MGITADRLDAAWRAEADRIDAAIVELTTERDTARTDLAAAHADLEAARADVAAARADVEDLQERLGEQQQRVAELEQQLADALARIAELEAAGGDDEPPVDEPPVDEPPAEDPFVIGVTKPMSTAIGDPVTNVGPTGPRESRPTYTGPMPIVGSTDPDHPTVIRGVNFLTVVTIASGYVDIDDCGLYGSNATTDTGLVDTRAAGVKRVRVTRCEGDPGQAGASQWINGVIGHHVHVERCVFRRVVDGANLYNTHADELDASFRGNLLEWHAYFYATTKGVVHPSDVRTHNDGIQVQGGRGVVIEGNRLRGFVFLPDGVTTPPDLTDVWAPLAHQGVQIQQNVRTNVPINPVVRANWIEGYQHPLVIRTREQSKGGGAPYDAVVEGNVMDDRHRYYATSGTDYYGTPGGKAYELRVDAAVTVNGVSYPTDGSPRPLPGGNVFEDTERVHAKRRGKPFTVRRDAFTGGGS